MQLREVSDAINYYIRPQTFPLAVKMCQSATELPQKVRIPSRNMGMQVTVCQAISMGRRYGWTVAIGKEDECCPFGAIALGLVPAKPLFLEGTYWEEGLMPGSREAVVKRDQMMKRLEYGKYSYLLLSPLDRADFEPDVIVVYGNSAQVMRLVQAALQGRGGVLTSTSSGALDCADMIVEPMFTNECRFTLPGGGNRVWGLTQDDEMVFSIPWSKADSTIRGLEESHRAGWRYPTSPNLRFAPEFPPAVKNLMEKLRQEP